jgi:hypothetical protein
MGVGFYLTGSYGKGKPQPAKTWLKQVVAWLTKNHEGEPSIDARQGRTEQGKPALYLDLYPCAQEVEIFVPRPGRVDVVATTSTVGPGYHIFLCDLLKKLGKGVGIAWDSPDAAPEGTGDETGYFHSGDRSAVKDEMLRWLKSTVKVARDSLVDEVGGMKRFVNVQLSMPMNGPGYHSSFGPVVTLLGPRSLAWCRTVVADPSKGINVFPWWEPGFGADFFLGRSLYYMWNTIRWRPPLDTKEWDDMMNHHVELCHAYALDSKREYPWREWRELIEHVKGDGDWLEGWDRDMEPIVRRRAARAKKGPLIGYRRKPVRVRFSSGWSIEIPGDMAEQWNEDGEWSAWNGPQTVWFHAWSFRKRDGKPPTARQTLEPMKPAEEGGELLEHRKGKILGKAWFRPHQEKGKSMWNLCAFSAVPGEAALCNFFFEKRTDRAWAESVWQSLEHA